MWSYMTPNVLPETRCHLTQIINCQLDISVLCIHYFQFIVQRIRSSSGSNCELMLSGAPITETLEPSVHLSMVQPSILRPSEEVETADDEHTPQTAAVAQSSYSPDGADTQNLSKYADKSSSQKSTLSASNRSMFSNSSMLAPSLTNMNSLSHLSVLQGIAQEVSFQRYYFLLLI